MIVGCYTLDLYCSKKGCTKPMPHQFTEQTEGECIREARKKGWSVSKATQLCPACSGKEPKPEEVPFEGTWVKIPER